MQCVNHLRQIGIAVRNYEDNYGCYPPTCTYDKSGRPLHSWRSLIKECMSSIPDKCKYNEPWDSPSNREVLADRRLAYIYQCPTDQAACAPGSTTTSYVALVGKRSAWRHGNAKSTGQKLPNHAADVFLVIEMANSGIQWTEPKDIDFDDAPALLSLAAKGSHACDNGYFFCKTPAVNAVLVHGDMIFLFPWNSSPSVLTGLLPPEVLLLPREEQRRIEMALGKDYPSHSELRREELRVHWPHLIGLPVWIVAVALLSYQSIVASRRLGRVIP